MAEKAITNRGQHTTLEYNEKHMVPSARETVFNTKTAQEKYGRRSNDFKGRIQSAVHGHR